MAGRPGFLTRGHTSRRRLAVLALAAAVALAHHGLGSWWAQFGWGARPDGAGAAPPRMDVAFVRELLPVEPAPAAATPPQAVAAALPKPARASVPRPRPPQPASAPPPEPAASDPTAQEREPASAVADSALVVAEPASAAEGTGDSSPDPVAEADIAVATAPQVVASAPAPAASSAVAPSASAASATAEPVASATTVRVQPADRWPPSTRLAFELSGNYRGELHGSASVEWLRAGSAYQVHMEALVGVPIAPLMARRIRSDGEITDQGLAPRRFEAEQRVGFSTRRWSIRFEPDHIVTGDGDRAPTQPGVQDEASQFVQLTWLFTAHPHLLRVGQSVQFPMVLRRRVDRWVYDVVQEEPIALPFGQVRTLHVKPRRPARDGDMTAEMWVAPSLQYLPVRILIRQRDDTYVDLKLKQPPQQAAPAASAPQDGVIEVNPRAPR